MKLALIKNIISKFVLECTSYRIKYRADEK